jgi:hypothetical protein
MTAPVGERFVEDAVEIMRIALGRRNENDPDSSDTVMLRYLNDFVSLKMPNAVKLFENFSELTFTIDPSQPDARYTFNEVGASKQFVNIGQEAFISLLDPIDRSISWNRLPIFQDPGEFYMIWGINNADILIPGYPTNVLYWGNEFVFRTIPNTDYQVKFFGYVKTGNYPNFNSTLEFDYWLRFVAYGAAVDYARDFRYSPEDIARIERTYASEKKNQLTHMHNQQKMSRAMPRF